ncbi:MAG: VOC family protein [Steroidobacteraceae bacterium]
MSNADIRGRFIWHELMTTDPDAASAFYSNLVPWKTQPSGMPSYTIWMSGKSRAGGLMALPHGDASGTPPHWIIYIGTPDVDGTVQAAQRLGGKVLKGAADIPNVGRFAVLSDPQGAAFALFTPAPGSSDGASPAGGVGEFTWHELATTDPDSALRFYSELFGWSKGAGHDMGAMGVYQLITHGGQDAGGVYKARDASTPPSWLSYVRVADAAKAASTAKAGGGRVLHGPIEVPGGSWIVMLLDPQGGAFAVVEAPKPAAARPPQPSAAKPAASAPKVAEAPKAAVKPAGTPLSKPGSMPPARAVAAPKAAAAPKSVPAAAAPKKAARKKARVKKRVAAKRKSAGARTRRSAAAKKRPAAKRAAGKKSTNAKRGSAARRGVKAGRRAAAKSARGKSKKHR